MRSPRVLENVQSLGRPSADRFFEEGKFDAQGRELPNKKAVQNEEQALLIEEMRDLRDCYITSG